MPIAFIVSLALLPVDVKPQARSGRHGRRVAACNRCSAACTALPLSPHPECYQWEAADATDARGSPVGTDKQDERGRTVDLHALRHTFGTHLSKNGVAPRTAQAAIQPS